MNECPFEQKFLTWTESTKKSSNVWGSAFGVIEGKCSLNCDQHCIRVKEVLKKYPLTRTMIIPGYTTIADCASLMKQHGMAAVLISQGAGQLSGIFTDRDLFLKMNMDHDPEVFWNAPVSTVMTKSVVTITADLVHLIPELMAKHKIRHIPIVENISLNQKCVLGMLSMESLFIGNVNAHQDWRDFIDTKTALTRLISVGILTKDHAMSQKVIATLSIEGKVYVRRIQNLEIMTNALTQTLAEDMQNFIIDLDSYDLRKMLRVIEVLKKNDTIENIVLLLTPQKHPELSTHLINLQTIKPFSVAVKPVEIRSLAAMLM